METDQALADIISPTPGIISVIGSGGKSTFLIQAAKQLGARGKRVVLATSTHMRVPEGFPLLHAPDEVARALEQTSIACIGEVEAGTGKLIAPTCEFSELARIADYILVEADGSRALPLKAHRPSEPVIPSGTVRTVLVVGASGFGRPIAETVHRPELFCALTGAEEGAAATPELVASAITAEGLTGPEDHIVINQVEDSARHEAAYAFQRALGRPVWVGSLRSSHLHRLA